MTRRLLLSYLVLAATVLIALEVPLAVLYARHERAALVATARRDATAIAGFAEEGLDAENPASLSTLVERYAVREDAEVLIAGADGSIVASRTGDQADDVDEARPPELAEALAGRPVTGTMVDDRRKLVVAAEPVGEGVDRRGAALVGLPTKRLDERVHAAWTLLGALAGGVLALAAFIGWRVARWVAEPVAALSSAVNDVAAGRLDARVEVVDGPPELRDLTRQFDEMARRIEGLVESQRRFVADASHQLRTPLTALRLRIENIEPSDDNVAAALVEVDRLSRLVDGLLMLSRGESQPPRAHPVDVRAIVQDRCDAWGPLAEEQGVALQAITPRDPSVIVADSGHLEQILDNLVANALEASVAGGGIEVEVGGDGPDVVVVTVTDHGRGMSDEHRDHAFDRFWQGPGGSTGRSGLGLPIVRQLVVVNGGAITLADTPGGGVRARLRFPASHRL